MKLCKDCKHCIPVEESHHFFWSRPIYDEFARCFKFVKKVDYINANHKYGFAETARSYSSTCGHEAKYWEPK